MPFFSPWMLCGLAAALAPVIIHLLRRRTAQRVVWGAWMFLAESMRLKRRRLRIEEILLLVIRTLVLALAAVAFARPFLPEMRTFGGGIEKDVVIVIDVSASMGLKDASGRTGLDRALEEARSLVEKAPRGTGFGVVLGDRVPTILSPAPFTSRTEVYRLLDSGIRGGVGTMDAPRSLAAAGEVLAAGNNPAKEVVVFGDGQGYGWRPGERAEWSRVDALYRRFKMRPTVVWRTLAAPKSVRNAALAAAVPSRRVIGTDRSVSFAVTVANSGSEPYSPGDVALAVDGAEISRLPVGQILPGLTRTFSFSHRFATNGLHDVVFSLAADDDIPGDNLVSNRVDVLDALDVLLVNGRPADKGYAGPTAFLSAALRPEGVGTNLFLVRPKTVRPAELENPKALAGVAAAILCDVPTLSARAMRNLGSWVEAGGGLLVSPAARAQADFYTNRLFAASWTNFETAVENVQFEGASVLGRARFDEAAITGGVEIVSRMSDGVPALVSARRGKGRTATLAVPMEMAWSALPAQPAFVPFAHNLVYGISATNSVAVDVAIDWRTREGDLRPLSSDEIDAVSTAVELAFARSADDTLAAVAGESFGVEIWRPIAILALVLLVLETLLGRRIDRSRGAQGGTRFQLALRILAFAAFAWMLLHVVWVHDHTRTVHRRVAVFTDRSRSMELRDGEATNALSRFEIATNVAAKVAGRLDGRYDVEPFDFGGDVTAFAPALEAALERIPSEELAGAVFVTDGRDTSGQPVEAASRRFARLGAKIATFVVGDASNRCDAAVARLATAENVFLGDKVRVSATIRVTGLAKRKFAVRFMEGDRLVERLELEADRDDWTRELHFNDSPEGRGVKRYRVELEPPEGDAEARNDSWPFDVSVSDDRTHVFLVDRRPRWEFRYLKNLFYGRDKSVHLQYFLTDPDRVSGAVTESLPSADATRPFGEAEAGALPDGREAWRKFEVVIVGDVDPAAFGERDVEDLRASVEERGATAVFIAGPGFLPEAWAKTPLGALLPVALTNAEGRVTAKWTPGETHLALTPSGSIHPITMIAENRSESERAWARAPALSARVTGITARPGAETLAYADGETALTAPLLVTAVRGRGKTLFVALDETWRLRYRKGDLWHHRFWGNVVKWGAGEKLRDGVEHARIGTDQLHYRPHAPAKVTVRLTDPEALPIESADATAEVKGPDGRVARLELVPREDANGYYDATFDATSVTGDYRVVVTCPKAAERLGEQWPTELATTFSVDEGFAPVEWAALAADGTLAKEMARLTGGAALKPDEVEKFDAEMFGTPRGEVVEHIESHLWDHPAALATLALALILLWWLRKRRGLA